MHIDYERIALWILVIVMFIKLFVIRELYTASSPLSIMDLAEFRGLPDDLKQIWQDNLINMVLPAIGTKITQAWNNSSTTRKTAIRNEFSTAATQLTTNINNITVPDDGGI